MARLLLSLLLGLALTLPARAEPFLPTPFEASGHFTRVQDLEKFLRELQSKSPWKVTVTSPTRSSTLGLPIWQVRLTPPGETPRLRVLVLARVHGNEPAATEAALALMRDVSFAGGEAARTYRSFEYLIVPCVNPEGATTAQHLAEESEGFWGVHGRENTEGEDCNRNYLRLSTSEARTAVQAYDQFKPQVVVDLHEFESRPLASTAFGWWRAEYWDFMVGAGRAPWAAPALRAYCRDVAEKTLFPALKGAGLRAEHYMLPSGSSDSSTHFASNAADYFLVRGSAAFLFESAGGDEGETSAPKRLTAHRVALFSLLSRVAADPEALQRVLDQGRQEATSARQVALSVNPQPRSVALQGTTSPGFGFESKIDVGGHSYHTHTIARFEGVDYQVKSSAPLPFAFLVQSRDPDYLQVLMLHGLSMRVAEQDFSVGSDRYPAGTVIVPASPLAGLLLLREVQQATPNHLPTLGIVAPAAASFTLPPGKAVRGPADCIYAARLLSGSRQSSVLSHQ